MPLLQLPHNIVNNTVSNADTINANFSAIVDLVNGNLDSDNLSPEININATQISSNKVLTNSFTATDELTFSLPSNDGSHSFKIDNLNSTITMTVFSNGDVEIS